MILIISRSSLETTTDEVIDHLRSQGVSFFRINGDDLEGVTQLSFRISGTAEEITLSLGTLAFLPRDVSVVWFRRWRNQSGFDTVTIAESASTVSFKLANALGRHLDLESRRLSAFLFSLFSHAEWLSEPGTASLNKLEVLSRAAKLGLEIPSTLVTTSRQELLGFIGCHGKVITKSVSESPVFHTGGESFPMYTVELDAEAAAGLPERFFFSLFQEALDKRFEVRVFYLAGELFPAAIFSQSDAETQTDFRRYNFARPNRIVPYHLSDEMCEKIVKLMKDLDLETGSLDFVKTVDGKMVFLEVNPIGQFGMISDPCNFQLERRVAELLVRKATDGEA